MNDMRSEMDEKLATAMRESMDKTMIDGTIAVDVHLTEELKMLVAQDEMLIEISSIVENQINKYLDDIENNEEYLRSYDIYEERKYSAMEACRILNKINRSRAQEKITELHEVLDE